MTTNTLMMTHAFRLIIVLTIAICQPLHAETLIEGLATNWKYLDNGTDQGTAWQAEAFDDSTWKTGSDQLGYGDGDESTIVNGGPAGAHYITTYFRYTFTANNFSSYQDLSLDILFDDGAVIYINNTEVFRDNLPAGSITYNTLASTSVENKVSSVIIPANILHGGTNTIAVEIHQASSNSSDISFAMALNGNYPDGIIEPAIYSNSPRSVDINWQTPDTTDGILHFGETPDALVNTVQDTSLDTQHGVRLHNLSPNTQYFYNFGNSTELLNAGQVFSFTTKTPTARGPYLQMLTPTSVVIRWNTSNQTDSVVHFGTDPNHLDQLITLPATTYFHEVTLNALTPATRYYYNTGSSAGVISAGADHFFKTQPLVGSHLPTRLWVIGDSGQAGWNNDPESQQAHNQRAVYQGYLHYTGNTHTDLWLMLGDNAYARGKDDEYQRGFFNIYTSLMHQTPVWPALGNHDGYTLDTPAQAGPYYDIFSLPRNGEAGGVSSGTEAYYSYNYGNIHFVVLDSFDVDRSASGSMAQWLINDLNANTADWIIAYWHHPPYSKGSHNSDNEIELIQMRENILPILEQYGVDLVLTGHSHNYERSKFIQGHYGYSNTYTDQLFAINAGSGDIASGATAYNKAYPAIPHGGTVYAVAGTSGTTGNEALGHPVMYRSLNQLGSMVININNRVMSAHFIDTEGNVQDSFTLQKIAGGTITDGDNDGIDDASDNCANLANSDQSNVDNDSQGDLCDADDDGDGIPDYIDADTHDASNTNERILPFSSSTFSGASVREKTLKP